MKRSFLIYTFLFSFFLSTYAQSFINEKNLAVPISSFKRNSIRFFNLEQVRLLESPFSNAQHLDANYLKSLSADRLLYRFYINAGLPAKDSIYGGWEREGLSGHSLGHYLSAISMMFASTGESVFREKADYIVNELYKCQLARKTGYIGAIPNEDSIFSRVARGEIKSGGFDLNGGWSPWYTVHKVMAGLSDAYLFTKNKLALQVLTKMGDWTYETVNHLSDSLRLKMLNCEYGGMADVLSFLYQATGNQKYLTLSYKFTDEFVLGKLAKGIDPLPGKHSNTNVPKAVASARQFEITGNKRDSVIADNFWKNMVQHHTYVIGGNSNYEYCGAPDSLNNRLSDNTCETCNTYNMLKLTRHLFSWNPDSQLVDYYERALYNHILASQNSSTGMMCYFVPLRMGTQKQYSDEFNTFTCCVGSGMENHSKYAENIFAYQENKLFVNLYIPALLNWKEQGLSFQMKCRFPSVDTVNVDFLTSSPKVLSWNFRKPSWVNGNIQFILNGKKIPINDQSNGYYTFKKKFTKNDHLQLVFPMQIYSVSMPDNPNRIAFKYGPWVLAGDLGMQRPDPMIGTPVLMTNDKNLNHWLIQTPSKIEFNSLQIGQPKDIILKPFYLIKDEFYSIYWDYFSIEQWEHRKMAYEAEKRKQAFMESKTIDYFRVGEMQPERDHQLFATEKSYVDDALGRKGREAREGHFFEFIMGVSDHQKCGLVLSLLGDDKNRKFDLLINDQLIETIDWKGGDTGKFYDLEFVLPESVTANKKTIKIKIAANYSKTAGRIFGVRTIRL